MGIQGAFLQDKDLSDVTPLVHAAIADRDRRQTVHPLDLFADPAWNMLLELYQAELQQVRVSVSVLSVVSQVPYSTALRWIAILENEGFLVRGAHSYDRRRLYVSLTTTGSNLMAAYFGKMSQIGESCWVLPAEEFSISRDGRTAQ